jgi:ABC-type multidrug transport system fused ATPase/permease subunit
MLLGVRVSRLMHAKMTYRIFHAKVLAFLDKIPLGRILNRFTTDIQNIDTEIMPSFSGFYMAFAYVIVDLVVVAMFSTYFTMIASMCYIFFAILIQKKFINTKREFVRLEAIARSPMVNSFSEILKGLPTVRTMGLEDWLKGKVFNMLDDVTKNSLIIFGLNG